MNTSFFGELGIFFPSPWGVIFSLLHLPSPQHALRTWDMMQNHTVNTISLLNKDILNQLYVMCLGFFVITCSLTVTESHSDCTENDCFDSTVFLSFPPS